MRRRTNSDQLLVVIELLGVVLLDGCHVQAAACKWKKRVYADEVFKGTLAAPCSAGSAGMNLSDG